MKSMFALSEIRESKRITLNEACEIMEIFLGFFFLDL